MIKGERIALIWTSVGIFLLIALTLLLLLGDFRCLFGEGL